MIHWLAELALAAIGLVVLLWLLSLAAIGLVALLAAFAVPALLGLYAWLWFVSPEVAQGVGAVALVVGAVVVLARPGRTP
jgi:hypothetical protein